MIRFEGFSFDFLRGLSDMAQGQLASQTFQVPDTVEAIEFYFEQGLTDGLPVVPPTPDMVARFLDAIGKAPGDVLGTIPTRKREITAEKVAINAIMAGCKPEYMPVVATAISAMCEEKFNLHGTSASTAGTGHMVLVHGPIVKELDINYANNLFGPTKRSNATIGRAIRLIIMNVCGSVPGILDKSTFGHPGKYSYCFAENEDLSPWAPLHVERGLSLESSAVTVMAGNAPIQGSDHGSHTAEGILNSLAGGILANGMPNGGELMVVISPEVLLHIREEGLSKDDVKNYLFEATKRPYSFWSGMDRGWDPEGGAHDNSEVASAVESPDNLMVIVAGGTAGGFFCTIMPWGGGKGTKSVTRQIPNM